MKEAEKGVAHGLLHAVPAAVKIPGDTAPPDAQVLKNQLDTQQATVTETYTKEIDNRLFTSILNGEDPTKSLNYVIPTNLNITTYNSIGVVYETNPTATSSTIYFQGRLESFEFYQADDILKIRPANLYSSNFGDLTEDSIRPELASYEVENLD